MNRFDHALMIFEESLVGMSLSAGYAPEPDEPTPEQRRARCLAKLTILNSVWNRDAGVLERLTALVTRSVDNYALNDLSKGHDAVKEIAGIIWTIRHPKPLN